MLLRTAVVAAPWTCRPRFTLTRRLSSTARAQWRFRRLCGEWARHQWPSSKEQRRRCQRDCDQVPPSGCRRCTNDVSTGGGGCRVYVRACAWPRVAATAATCVCAWVAAAAVAVVRYRKIVRSYTHGRNASFYHRSVEAELSSAGMKDGEGLVRWWRRRRQWRFGLCVMRLRRRKAWKTEWVYLAPGCGGGRGCGNTRARALSRHTTLFALPPLLSTSRFSATAARGV